MWAPIFLENKVNMLEALDSYIRHLSTFRDKIDHDDVQGLFGEMREANKIRDILDLEK
jgi:prephenate dehydrogenase